MKNIDFSQYKKPNRGVVVGITGGIASGKTTWVEFFKAKGLTVIDADVMAHQAYAKGTKLFHDLVSHFGQGIVAANGEIDRKKLGAIVFSDPSERAVLNGLVWPCLAKAMQDKISELVKKHPLVLVEAAVLIEASFTHLVDFLWVIYADREVAIKRLEQRNGLNAEDAKKRIEAQLSNEARIKKADMAIANNGSKEELEAKLAELWSQLQPILHKP